MREHPYIAREVGETFHILRDLENVAPKRSYEGQGVEWSVKEHEDE